MPHTRSRCSSTRAWNGQLASTTSSPCDAGFVALVVEHREGGVEEGAPARPLPRLLPRPLAELAPALGGDPGQRLTDRRAGAGCIVDRGGEQPRGEVVLAGREAHRQLAPRRAGTASPVAPRRDPDGR